MEETTIRSAEPTGSFEPAPSLRVVFENETAIAAIAGRIHVAIVRGALEPADVTLGDSIRASCSRELGRPTAVLVTSREGLEMPQRDAVIARSIEIARAHGSDVVAVAVVVGGAGFWASAARSALNSVVVVARQSYPTRFFARTADACAFLLDALGDASPCAESLASEVEALLA